MCRLISLLYAVAICLAASIANASSLCGSFYAKLPNVSLRLCEAAKLAPSGALSVQRRPILLRDIRPIEPRLRVLLLAAMHGDELSSAAVALHWLALAQSDPQHIHWRFIPLLNPDGLIRNPAWRLNANAVDLNRNFPTPNWQYESKIYWEQHTHKDPRRWPGRTPLSEPEAKYLFDEISHFKPHVIVSIHAPYGVLDLDGPARPPSRLGHLYLNRVGVFPGSLGNYAGIQSGVPVVTVELPNALRTPTKTEINKMWRDLLGWLAKRRAKLAKTATLTLPVKLAAVQPAGQLAPSAP